MQIKPSPSAKNELLGVYARAMQESMIIEKTDLARLYNLRCSGLPYCPTKVLLNYGRKGLYTPINMGMSFYIGVGHAVHHTMQTYLSQSGQFMADYECKECGKKYPLSLQHECCGFPTSYEEVTLDIGKRKYLRVQGHIDAIFKTRKGKIYIVDFKTTSLKSIESAAKKPALGYMRQVRAYAYLLWKQYGVKVDGVMLMFIPRDNPLEPKVWELAIEGDTAELGEELLVDRKLHRRTMQATTVEEMMALSKAKCGSYYCEACKKPSKELRGLFTRFVKTKNKFPILEENL